jgi:hypothetical protein
VFYLCQHYQYFLPYLRYHLRQHYPGCLRRQHCHHCHHDLPTIYILCRYLQLQPKHYKNFLHHRHHHHQHQHLPAVMEYQHTWGKKQGMRR